MSDLTSYDYDLPEELIAQEPAAQRDAARLMVVDRRTGSIAHRSIRDFPEYVRPHDAIVVNDSKVVPARLVGQRVPTNGAWEALYLGAAPDGNWRVLCRTRGKLKAGDEILCRSPDGAESLTVTMVAPGEAGEWRIRSTSDESPEAALTRVGWVPLPPYIRKGREHSGDRERYQTVYAAQPGSVAAPTAGLHFTPELLRRVEERGATIARTTLHVGIGTFRPISVSSLADHVMHSEEARIEPETVALLNARRAAGGRIVAIGTTSVRTLESAAASGELRPFHGQTNLFIRPPYTFHAVDALLTNFHLPRSSLLVLVSAFAGLELMQRAYKTAVEERYRFFSYGDAMLIV